MAMVDVAGIHALDDRGKPVVRRASDASLFAFEKTSTLVPTGIR